MVRLVELSEGVRTAFRPWASDPAAVVTMFGGATLLLFVLSLWFWVGDRRKIATVVSYAFVALSLVLLVKTLFGMPRPPESVWTVTYDGDPYGFPSGHAVAAVVVYGGLVTVYDRFDPPTLAAAGVVIAVIALSRVVIGVHYLGDILAGLALGAALLGTLWKTVGPDPLRAFAIAAVLAAVAALVGAPESALALGGSLGGLAGSLGLERLPDPRSHAERGVLAVAGVVVVLAFDQGLDAVSGLPLTVLGNAVLVVAILLLPLVVGKIPHPTR